MADETKKEIQMRPYTIDVSFSFDMTEERHRDLLAKIFEAVRESGFIQIKPREDAPTEASK